MSYGIAIKPVHENDIAAIALSIDGDWDQLGHRAPVMVCLELNMLAVPVSER